MTRPSSPRLTVWPKRPTAFSTVFSAARGGHQPVGRVRRQTVWAVPARWAAAVSSFAEILKSSPFVSRSALDHIESIVTGGEWLDSDRAEFAELFAIARPLIAK